MTPRDVIMPVERTTALPVVRRIRVRDLRYALARGLDDFRAMPTHIVFLVVIYPVAGLLLARAMFGLEVVPLLYPIATGFALLGPFTAIGLYELSRRREQGLDTSWRHVVDIVHSPSFGPIVALGLLLVLLFAVWIGVAHALYLSYFGRHEPQSIGAFLASIVGTPEGRRLILIGNAIGFLFAALAFVLNVVSFPLLVDRDVGLSVAVATSLKAVATNPWPMAVWAAIIAGALLAGSLPVLVGLALVLPVLGHASWHLYRLVVEPDFGPRPIYDPPPKGPRYAADFPVSLFARSPLDEAAPSGQSAKSGRDAGEEGETQGR